MPTKPRRTSSTSDVGGVGGIEGAMVFAARLNTLNASAPSPAHFVFVPYDQLSAQIGPLSRLSAAALGVVVVECPAKAAKRPYHRQKLALLLTNLRHFALEQAAAGRRVVHLVSDGGGDYASALRPFAAKHGPLLCMTPAERELRSDLQPLVDDGLLEMVAHEGWLSDADDFAHASKSGAAPWRMDAFYRQQRTRTGLLMVDGKPEGGRFSHDGDNREAWKGQPPAPTPPRFVVDDVTAEVVAMVDRVFADHPGAIDAGALPASADDAEALWQWAMVECLPHFGPYEDAMSTRSRGLFHTRISGLLNLHRLLPRRVVDDVAALPIPLQSREGFVRQVLGWREFVRHVHTATDGFRRGPGADVDGAPNFVGAHAPLPAAFWPASWKGARSGLRCLDLVVEDVWAESYSHHIGRLMVLANIATLLDIEPRALCDWFWVAYVDAYDWVVEPNVLGMGTFAAGDVMTTKPYVAGAAYIDKMSDYCAGCAFKPKKSVDVGGCPLTSLYWAYLQRHAAVLADVDRLALPLAASRKRTSEQVAHAAFVFDVVTQTLAAGQPLTPKLFASKK